MTAISFDPTRHFEAEVTRSISSGVWTVAGRNSGIGYDSDQFAQVELLSIIEQATDITSMSLELEALGRSWPARYYLSPERCNVLRPFKWNSEASVLEVGSGCGTITRYLGETFREVLAVEGELHRAVVGGARSRDQANVAVVCSPLQAIRPDSDFDLVFCIGVLEYAPLFSGSPRAMEEMLSFLYSRVRPGGSLVLAIENQLGVKYFSGAVEDHTGIAYDGIEGYRRSAPVGPRTVGRNELERLLVAAGFGHVDFFCPFPDYKFPTAIARESALATADPSVVEYLAPAPALDYQARPTVLRFDQRAVWRQLTANGIAGHLANSFLIIASTGEAQNVAANWDMASYRMQPRRPEFWYSSVVSDLGTSSAKNVRQALFTDPPKGAAIAMATSLTESWHVGVPLDEAAARVATDRGATLDGVAQVLKPWADALLDWSDSGFVDGSKLDCVPRNFLVGQDGAALIDNEWTWHEPIPLRTLLVRGIVQVADRILSTPGNRGPAFRMSVGRQVIGMARALGADVGWRDLWAFSKFDAQITAAVYMAGARSSSQRLIFGRLVIPRSAGTALRRVRRVLATGQWLGGAVVRRIRK